jgi:hypothetical protein
MKVLKVLLLQWFLSSAALCAAISTCATLCQVSPAPAHDNGLFVHEAASSARGHGLLSALRLRGGDGDEEAKTAFNLDAWKVANISIVLKNCDQGGKSW